MKFLIDENLAKSAAQAMRDIGYFANHVSEVGLTSTDDGEIVRYAIEQKSTIITFDLDFTRIVALSKLSAPSVISLRLGELSIADFRELMLLHIPVLGEKLSDGVLVTIDTRGVRIQQLPILKK